MKILLRVINGTHIEYSVLLSKTLISTNKNQPTIIHPHYKKNHSNIEINISLILGRLIGSIFMFCPWSQPGRSDLPPMSKRNKLQRTRSGCLGPHQTHSPQSQGRGKLLEQRIPKSLPQP